MKKEKIIIAAVGLVIGVTAALLVVAGNPANMGFCIACFLRDTAGALGLHRAAPVQYIRPEIPGLIIGAFLASLVTKEYSPRGGSAPFTRFLLGFCTMIGALMFLGCPFRMLLRLAGGDGNAILGLVGFVLGILGGVFFLQKGYSLKRTYKLSKVEGVWFPTVQAAMLVLLVVAPSFIFFTESGGGPGAKHAAIWISLAAGLLVGVLAQRSRFCMVAGTRDALLFHEWKMIIGFVCVVIGALVVNLITGNFHAGFSGQPIAHTDGLWNLLGMLLVGFASVLLGGCPMRQLILAGEGNIDSVVTIIGLIAGAAFAHNFGLASSAAGPTDNGKIAVVIGIVFCLCVACANTIKRKK